MASACTVPEKFRKEIESKCYKYTWDDKLDKVNRNTMIKSNEEGGLQMIDIQSYFMSLKASWVSKLISNDISNWKLIPLKYLSVVGINWLIFKMNFEKKKILDYIKHIPEFYREVFKCWVISGGGQTKKLPTSQK